METKFRGIIEETNTWVYGSLIQDVRSRYIVEKDSKIWTSYPPNYEETKDTQLRTFGKIVIPETVGQFVGLKDKNGVEIYCGDIVVFEDNTNPHVVDYSGNSFVLKMNNERISVYNWVGDAIKVIGNIHTTPELLTVKTK